MQWWSVETFLFYLTRHIVGDIDNNLWTGNVEVCSLYYLTPPFLVWDGEEICD